MRVVCASAKLDVELCLLIQDLKPKRPQRNNENLYVQIFKYGDSCLIEPLE